jgi:hypothetical protein
LQAAAIGRAYGSEQRIGKIAPEHRADLRDFARFAKPIEASGERLLKGRRDRLQPASLAAFQE